MTHLPKPPKADSRSHARTKRARPVEPSVEPSTITKAEATKRLGLTLRQLERYVEEGIPCLGSGRARRFPWPTVRHWRDERIRRKERERLAPKREPIEGLADAERRTAIADAELKELKLAQLRGELAPVEDFRREIADALARVRMLILRQPDLPPPAVDALLRAIQADPPPVEDPPLSDPDPEPAHRLRLVNA